MSLSSRPLGRLVLASILSDRCLLHSFRPIELLHLLGVIPHHTLFIGRPLKAVGFSHLFRLCSIIGAAIAHLIAHVFIAK